MADTCVPFRLRQGESSQGLFAFHSKNKLKFSAIYCGKTEAAFKTPEKQLSLQNTTEIYALYLGNDSPSGWETSCLWT